MNRLRFLLLVLASLLSTGVAPAAATQAPIRLPVVFATDIGTDIDDTWALAMLLRSPELDLKLVLTETGDPRYRAAVAAKFLEAAGRSDVPIGLGEEQGTMPENVKNQAPWLAGYDLAHYPGRVHSDGVSALIDLVENSRERITVIATGPVPNLARALEKDPKLAAKCRLVGMFGSFEVGYGSGPPAAESNVRVAPAALRAVLAAPWQDILLTPLDTCGRVSLGGAKYHAIWESMGDPVLRAVIENYCIFAPRVDWMRCDFFATRSTVLFDCVAVYLAYSEDLVETETVQFDITGDGFTRRSAHGPFKARVALRWKNLAAFEDHLVERLTAR
jgi:inosine-uridine nucleoside N-ribohydrolase